MGVGFVAELELEEVERAAVDAGSVGSESTPGIKPPCVPGTKWSPEKVSLGLGEGVL